MIATTVFLGKSSALFLKWNILHGKLKDNQMRKSSYKKARNANQLFLFFSSYFLDIRRVKITL